MPSTAVPHSLCMLQSFFYFKLEIFIALRPLSHPAERQKRFRPRLPAGFAPNDVELLKMQNKVFKKTRKARDRSRVEGH